MWWYGYVRYFVASVNCCCCCCNAVLAGYYLRFRPLLLCIYTVESTAPC